jgi:hypothetical protein
MAETKPTVSLGFFPRLGSVLALAPLGLWVCWHLWENLYAVVGEAAWQERVTDRQHPVAGAHALGAASPGAREAQRVCVLR